MYIRVALIILFWAVSFYSFGQNELFSEAFESFATSRFWDYEEVDVTWNMEGTIQAEVNEGLNNLFEQKPDMAEANFTGVLKKDSSIWEVYYYRAAAKKQLRKFKSAENDLRRALKLHNDFYEGYVELAKVLYLRYQIDESERMINRAIRIDKSKGTAYYIRGDIRMAQGLLKPAINSYKDCLEADSLFHNARIKLGLLEYVNKRDESRMIGHLTTVLSYDSMQKTALLFRSALMFDNDKKQSVRDLDNLILASPFNYMAYYFRGVCLTELGDYYRAFSDFHKVIKANSSDENEFVGKQTWLDKKIDMQNAGAYMITRVYGLPDDDGLKLKQAYCHMITGEFDKGIAVIQQVPKHDTEPLAVYLNAVAHEHKGEHNKAFDYYNRALFLDNEIADAHKKRAIYEQELKQWDSSIKDLNEVLRILPESYIIYRIRGISYYHSNQLPEAIDDFTKYLAHDSTDREILSGRGMAYLKVNQRLKAYVDLADAHESHLLNFKDMEALVDSVLTSDTTQALFYLDRITSSAPYFTEGYVMKFKIHLARNEWKPVEDNIAHAVRNSRMDAAKTKHSYLLTVQAMNFARLRHEEDAITSLNNAIKYDKNNSTAYLERGKVLISMGRASKAKSDLKKALSLGNKQASVLLDTLE